jgi:hypothetical protein
MKLTKIMLEADCVVRHPGLSDEDGTAARLPSRIRYEVDLETGECTACFGPSDVNLVVEDFWIKHLVDVGQKVKEMVASSPFAAWDFVQGGSWSIY